MTGEARAGGVHDNQIPITRSAAMPMPITPINRDAGTTTSHHWPGVVAFPFDQLPKLKVHDGVIYPAGYCGSGTVWARWLGQKAAQMVLGDVACVTSFSSGSADTVFAGIPFRSMPFYSGEPWFYRLRCVFIGSKRR